MKNIVIAVQNFGGFLVLHLRHGKPLVDKSVRYDEHHVLIQPAQMEIQGRMLRLQAGLDSQHPGQIHGIHVDGINLVRDVDIHFDVLIDGQEQLGI